MKWIACVPANVDCQELTRVKFFLLLSFPVFLSRSLLLFPLIAFLSDQHLGHLLAQPGSCTAWEELVAHHPSSVISTSERFRGREGGMRGCRVGVSRETSRGPTTGAREPGSKNKVVVCFLYSALLVLLCFFTLCCCYSFLNHRHMFISM